MIKDKRNLIWKLSVSIGLTLSLFACGDDDDYTYPSLISEFADVQTDDSGTFTYIHTDNGESLPIVNSHELAAEGITPDTLYRVLSRYELVDKGAKLYAIQAIPAPLPLPPTDFPDGVKADPLEMQSLWRGGNYLNMILLVKAQKGKHTFCFIEDSLVVSPSDGHTILYLRLYHDAGDDIQAYTQKAYLSVPLSQYADRLTVGDSISLRIPTAQGWQEWKRGYML